MRIVFFVFSLITCMIVSMSAAAQVQVFIDSRALSDLAEDVPDRVLGSGLATIRYRPFEKTLHVNSRLADLTCEFRNSEGMVIDQPESDFQILIDEIEAQVGKMDPNVDSEGEPIRRSYPIDIETGSINQLFSSDLPPVLDICTSAAGCDEAVADAVKLYCREAGTAIFQGDFEPPVLALQGQVTASTESAVAGRDDFSFHFSISNTGELTATGLALEVVLDALPPGLNLAGFEPSQGSYDPLTGVWQIGELVPGGFASLALDLDPAASAPVLSAFCGSMQLQAVDGNPQNSALAEDTACVGIERQIDLVVNSLTAASTVPAGAVVAVEFQVRNQGPSDASNLLLVVGETLPPEVSRTDVSTNLLGQFSEPGNWEVSSLSAGGAQATVALTYTVGSAAMAGQFIEINTSVAASNETVINPDNDSSLVQIEIVD